MSLAHDRWKIKVRPYFSTSGYWAVEDVKTGHLLNWRGEAGGGVAKFTSKAKAKEFAQVLGYRWQRFERESFELFLAAVFVAAVTVAGSAIMAMLAKIAQ